MVVHHHLLHWDSNLSYQQQQNNQQILASANYNYLQPQLDYHILQAPNDTLQQNVQNVEWKNTFNMRNENLKVLSAQKRANLGAKENESALVAKSLNLIRKNLQTAINREIDAVITRYIEKFFQPAMENLKRNLSNKVEVDQDDHLKNVCRCILQEAKQMYQPPNPVATHPESKNLRHQNSFQVQGPCEEFEATQSLTSQQKKKVKAAPKTSKPDNLKREAPKWDPERINKETLFVMGSRANKAMGFGATRGRLYIKHPEVFRYSGDQEDKEWLVRHTLMPPTGQKAYIMIVDDITQLAHTPEYKNSPNVLLRELKGFEAPDFMVQKIKNYMHHMRTDLPGGHRRYKRPTTNPIQQIEPTFFPHLDHQLAPPRNNLTSVEPQHFEIDPTLLIPHSAENTLQLIGVNGPQMADSSNQQINFQMLWGEPYP